LSALLQAAGGTLPVIKKDERGVFVMVETETSGHGAHAAKPAPAKPAAPAATATPAATPAPKAQAAAPAPKPAAPAAAKTDHKTLGQNPNRQLFKRSNYVGVQDTGPVAGETFEQKVARLKALSAAAKQRQEEGGGEAVSHAAPAAEVSAPPAPAASASDTSAAARATAGVAEQVAQSTEVKAAAPAPASTHKPTGNADRTLMKRSTYCGVTDTGPVPGETFQQKIARLTALSAAAKQRSEGG